LLNGLVIIIVGILLKLVIDVMLSSRSEVLYKSKVKGRSKRVSANVLIEF
jgi:hypothetical protein